MRHSPIASWVLLSVRLSVHPTIYNAHVTNEVYITYRRMHTLAVFSEGAHMAKRNHARFTVNKHTALAIIRYLRAHEPRKLMGDRRELSAPDPGATGRWSARLIDLSLFGLPGELANWRASGSKSSNPSADGRAGAATSPSSQSSGGTVCVAVPCAKDRLRVKGVENTVYSMGLPRNSFIDLGEGLATSSPELLFVEMAAELPPFEHMLLGMELIGGYALDAADPDNGPV